jgi:AcrR family transcriptional regulator
VRSRGRPRRAGSLGVGAEAIIESVCKLLRKHEPREVTLALVARRIGADRSLIRYYFRNRATLLLAVSRHLFDKMLQSMRASRALRSDDADSRLRETVRALLRFHFEYPFFHRLVTEETSRSPDADAREFFRSFVDIGMRFHRTVAKQGAEEGQFRPYDAEFLYLAVVGMCEFFASGSAYLKVAFGKTYDADRINRQYEEFVCSYVVDGIRAQRGRGPGRRAIGAD